MIAIAAAAVVIPQTVTYAHTFLASSSDPAAAIDSVVPKNACVVSDIATLLVLSQRFESNGENCPTLIDPFGMWIVYDHGQPPPASPPFPPRFVSMWRIAFVKRPTSYCRWLKATTSRGPQRF